MKVLASVGEIADFLKVGVKAARKAIRGGGLPVMVLAGSYYTTDEAVMQWINSNVSTEAWKEIVDHNPKEN